MTKRKEPLEGYRRCIARSCFRRVHAGSLYCDTHLEVQLRQALADASDPRYADWTHAHDTRDGGHDER